MKHRNINKSGFTIIEISLVLAIAGLILVMVFIALPALQRQARDAKRKEDTLTFIQAVKKYQQNNHGNTPYIDKYEDEDDNIYYDKSIINWAADDNDEKPWYQFYMQYLGDNFTSPDGGKYRIVLLRCTKTNSDNQCQSGLNRDFDSYNNPSYHRAADFYVIAEAVCDDNFPVKSSNPRNLAIVVPLESSGHYCANT